MSLRHDYQRRTPLRITQKRARSNHSAELLGPVVPLMLRVSGRRRNPSPPARITAHGPTRRTRASGRLEEGVYQWSQARTGPSQTCLSRAGWLPEKTVQRLPTSNLRLRLRGST